MRRRKRIPFWAQVDITPNLEDCWIWKGYRDQAGYGIVRRNGKAVRAHRYALVCYDAIPLPSPHIKALHSCDNRSCCNPTHLRWGSQQDNVKDRLERNPTGSVLSGERNGQAKLTKEQVLEIRRRIDSGKELQKDIAADFNVHRRTIYGIKNRKNWAHLE